MAITRLSGGITPGDGADPRTFPAIWNAAADEIEASQNTQGSAISALESDFASLPGRNFLYNGAMAVAQRGTSFTASNNNDDVYTLDRWNLLSDGNDAVDVTQSTDGPERFAYSMALDVETADKKFGIVQILENKDSIQLENQTVTLSFYAKVTGTSISNVKAAVLSWSSTADSVTSDVVSAWGASGTTPTFATNWTAENTSANLNVTTSWARYSVTATVDTASMVNVAAFIWCDDATTTLGDFLYVTGVQLEVGPVATPFEFKPYGQELAECQRYYYRTTTGNDRRIGAGFAKTTTLANIMLSFPTSMRTVPTALEQSGTAGNYGLVYLNTGAVCSAVPTFISATPDSATVEFTVASGLTAGHGLLGYLVTGQNGYLAWSAEL